MSSDLEKITKRLLNEGFIVRRSSKRIEASKGDLKLVFYPKLGGILIIKYLRRRVLGKAYGSFFKPDEIFRIPNELT